uniref:(northern house mosquito) hypothetical protein n=1 Tax=Culex pipiens TaxID=7175 RepID=A0A8D8DUF1_CULPI
MTARMVAAAAAWTRIAVKTAAATSHRRWRSKTLTRWTGRMARIRRPPAVNSQPQVSFCRRPMRFRTVLRGARPREIREGERKFCFFSCPDALVISILCKRIIT